METQVTKIHMHNKTIYAYTDMICHVLNERDTTNFVPVISQNYDLVIICEVYTDGI